MAPALSPVSDATGRRGIHFVTLRFYNVYTRKGERKGDEKGGEWGGEIEAGGGGGQTLLLCAVLWLRYS